MAYLYLLMIQKYLLTWLCSILLIYQQLDDSIKIIFFLLYASWCIPNIHFFVFLTWKWCSIVVPCAKVNMKLPIASVIYRLENMEHRTFFHQRNQFSDMDRYETAKLLNTFDYTLVSHLPNHIHHLQLSQ